MSKKKWSSIWSAREAPNNNTAAVETNKKPTAAYGTYYGSYGGYGNYGYGNYGYNNLFTGYSGYGGYYRSTNEKEAIIEKFRKVYKHIDDLKSILSIPEDIRILFSAGFTTRNCSEIYIKTEMFDKISDYQEALNICLGGALIECAKHYVGAWNSHSSDEDMALYDIMHFDEYEEYVLSICPGYESFIQQFKTYKEDAVPVFAMRHDSNAVKNAFTEDLSTEEKQEIKDVYPDTAPTRISRKIIERKYEISKVAQAFNGGVSKDIIDSNMAKMASGLMTKLERGYAHIPLNNESEYKRVVEIVGPYISMVSNALGKFFVNTKVRHYGSRSGTLDSNKLVEAIQGAPNVYYNEFDRKSAQLDLCVVVDESGSMSGERIEMAKQGVILLAEACKELNCNLYIYGHSADIVTSQEVDIFCYKDACNSSPYALGGVRARSNNADGYALREIAKKVRQQTSNQVLMFVLSDGRPNAHVYNRKGDHYYGIKDTRNAVKELEAQNFVVTQCTFRGVHVDSAEMFTNFIEINNVDESEFATKLCKYISGTLVNNYRIIEG